MSDTPNTQETQAEAHVAKPEVAEKKEASSMEVRLRRTKRMMVAAVAVIIVLLLAGLGIFGYWSVYVAQNTDSVTTGIKKVFSLPVGSVNGGSISFSQFEKRVQATEQFYAKQDELQLGIAQNPGADAIRQQEFDRLVDESLLDELAKEYDVTVSDADVDQYYQETIVPQAQGGEDEITKTLNDLYGWSIDDFKKEVLQDTVLRQKVQEKISGQQNGEAAEKQKIDEIYKDIKENGKSFEDEAKDLSDDSGSAEQGGALGSISKGQTVQEFEDKAFNTPVGELSEPFQTQYGWHILRVNSRDDSAETVDVSHILISTKQVQDILDERRVTAKVRAFLSGITTEVQ